MNKYKLAGREPTRCRTAYSVLYPEGNPREVTHDAVFNPKNFRNKNTNEGWIAGSAMDPLAEALKADRVTRVDPGEFRTLGENAFPHSPTGWP